MVVHKPGDDARKSSAGARCTEMHREHVLSTDSGQEVNILFGFLASYVLRAFTSSAEAQRALKTGDYW